MEALYEVEFTGKSLKQFTDLSADVQVRIKKRIDGLADDPRPPGCQKLEGFKSAYRLRIGDYRVIYEVFDEERIVTVSRVAHRGSAYRNL